VLVHEFGGVEDGVGLGDGEDVFDSVVAMIALGPVFFVYEELCDGLHDRFLSTPQSEEGVVLATGWGGAGGLAYWCHVLLCTFWRELEGENEGVFGWWGEFVGGLGEKNEIIHSKLCNGGG